ncbi:DNA-binding response regulator [Pseudomonas syringae pv. cilantro]|uniref:DNA-binding response regulator n=2 Tax=Pseudomonas syringae group TaxID=136849 RepID=A0A0N0XAB7_PSESX|nr:MULTISPECIES: response regulator transcription factor [Pseudomonas syringae group]KPC31855.1 DNA-binding response regulator [Pseudomonas syringae pv. cilantro]RMN13018.1 DNA-binding response regulator [Pseudomonas syringae pv. coriandricola]
MRPSLQSRPAPRILVVDDHRKIRDPLAVYLRRHLFDVRTAEDAAGMWQLLKQLPFDAVVLDVMLPDGDGFELCSRLHRRENIPVILLTARDTCADRVHGLDIGADDYITKPFEPRELVARLNSVLRRRGPVPSGIEAAPVDAAPALTHHYAFAGLRFISSTATLLRSDGSAVRLSTVESRLLGVLLSHPNTILSRQRLIDLTARPGCEVYDRAIDRQISRLRRKLGDNPVEPVLLRTIWGDGYLLAATVATLDA